MGNQQSISSNNHNDNENKQGELSNQIVIAHVGHKANQINLSGIKFEKNSCVLWDRSEMSSSDIMMKETNESIKSIDDVNMKNDFFNNLNSQKNLNTKNQHSDNPSSNQHKKIFIKIVWKEGGENVFISGNFVNWNQRFYMNRKDQHFEIVFVIFSFINFRHCVYYIYK